MKKISVISIVVCVMFLAGICFASDDDPFRGCDPNAPGKGGIKLVKKVDEHTAVFQISYDPYQHVEEKLDKVPDWRIYASYQSLVDGKWVYHYPQDRTVMVNGKEVKAEDYEVSVKWLGDYTIEATIKFKGSEKNVYNPRFWGLDKKSGKPLWINRHHDFCRDSDTGYQAYEGILDLNKIIPLNKAFMPVKHSVPKVPVRK